MYDSVAARAETIDDFNTVASFPFRLLFTELPPIPQSNKSQDSPRCHRATPLSDISRRIKRIRQPTLNTRLSAHCKLIIVQGILEAAQNHYQQRQQPHHRHHHHHLKIDYSFHVVNKMSSC